MKRNVIFDAMRNIDPKYIEAAAPREGRRTARAGHWKIAAIAAAVALLAVGVIAIMPFLLKNGETEITTAPGEDTSVEYVAEILSPDSEGKYHIADIPVSKEDVGDASFSWVCIPKGAYDIEFGQERVLEFFNISEMPMDDISVLHGKAVYAPSGEIHHFKVVFTFEDPKGSISTVIERESKWDHSLNTDMPRSIAGEYSVMKTVLYSAYTSEGVPDRTSGTMFIYMGNETEEILLVGGLDKAELTEKVFNFLLNAEFDFEALKK